MKNEIKELISYIDFQQSVYIEIAKKDKSKKKSVEAILTATTLIKMKAQKLLKNDTSEI